MSKEQQAGTTKKIIDLVNKKKGVMENNRDEAEKNSRLAASAIMQGRSSPEWREYMLQYVEQDPLNAAQLARLLAEDGTLGDAKMDRRRAYLLANAVCGGDSPGNNGEFNFTVDTIDDGL